MQPRRQTPLKAERKNPFNDNVKVTFTDKHMIVESDGIPNHPHGDFPNASNPNSIKKQNYKFYIPLEPKPADKPTKTPFGPIGVAINGIPFYNQYNAEGGDAVKLEVFDSCCGHPDPQGRYHYHKYPVCVKSPFKDEAGQAFAADRLRLRRLRHLRPQRRGRQTADRFRRVQRPHRHRARLPLSRDEPAIRTSWAATTAWWKKRISNTAHQADAADRAAAEGRLMARAADVRHSVHRLAARHRCEFRFDSVCRRKT